MRRFLAAVLILLGCVVHAQLVPAPTQGTTPDAGQPNAKAAVRALIEAVRSGEYDDARKVLDLRSLNFAIRDSEGTRRAQMLNSILNRDADFNPDLVPDNGTLPKVTIMVRGEAEGHADARVELAPVAPGDWRFTAETVGALPQLWGTMRDHVPVQGLASEYEGALDTAQQLRNRVSRHLWREFLGIEVWQWIAFAVLLAAGWLVGRLLRTAVSHPLRKRLGDRAAKTLDRLKRSISFWVGGSLWAWAIPYLDLPDAFAAPLMVVVKLIVTVAGISTGIALVDLLLEISADRTKGYVKRADSIFFPILRNILRFVVVVLGAVAFLTSLDVNVTGIVAGLGISGLVLAFAAKDSVENLFGSLTILFDMPFGIGDWVKIGADVNGVVEEINLRSTRVRTPEDSIITVPNSNLTKASVENFGVRRQRRINLTLGISHQNELTRVLDFADKLREYMRSQLDIREDNAYAYVTGFTDAGVSVLVQGYILTTEYEHELKVRQELVEAMARIAANSGVDLGPIHWPVPPPEKKT